MFECNVVEVGQGTGGAVSPDAVSSDLAFDSNVFLYLIVPPWGALPGKSGEGDAFHAGFGLSVTQILSCADHLLKRSGIGDTVACQKGSDLIDLMGRGVTYLGICTQGINGSANKNFAARHVLSHLLAGVAKDDHPAAVHHVSGHETGVSSAAKCAFFHHLTGTGTHIAFDDNLPASKGFSGNGAGIAAHHDAAGEHVIAHPPADVVFNLDMGAITESAAEIAGGSMDRYGDGVG